MSTDLCSSIGSGKQSRLPGGALGNTRNAQAGIGSYANTTIWKFRVLIAEAAKDSGVEAGQRVDLLISRANANSVDEYEYKLTHVGKHTFLADKS
jgi:hypothetical protein